MTTGYPLTIPLSGKLFAAYYAEITSHILRKRKLFTAKYAAFKIVNLRTPRLLLRF